MIALVAAAEAGAWRAVHAAAETGREAALVKVLRRDRRSLLREVAARGLQGTVGSGAARAAARERLEDRGERGLVRAQCAVALARWHEDSAVPSVIAAVKEVDAESRWWLALALHGFDTTEARAELAALTGDPDLYVAASAREWTP